ncbi:MAG: hypothetical protein K9J37_15355 [Saprospiraceae bacterium]|nr:hypothetical protein [Saprospiraceae bacterium]MCF8251288.1 hypothetical protein [Saprospiraceae bacterium]MCF8280821.1 hypothetical protein [Bacteroidales bacterium]MCF8311825.1 hypothetical protein [Saprospiraceae bacterium]MCF8441966.1 hypothetical protein [Saprospiraceae bacterium]
MKSTKISLFMALLVLATASLHAQQFLAPSFTYSGKKIAYLTMMDGTEKQVYVKSIDRKKGLIEEIKIEDEAGKKSKLKPEQIKHMYLPQSGWDKMSKGLDKAFDVQKWEDESLDPNKFAEGYVYFEQAEVQVKKQKMTMLMQLLNPAFCNKIKVYHDPYASESASVGIGGMTLAGGDDKSYYVSVRNKTAFKLMKKNYDEEYSKVFGLCTPMKNKFEKVKWSDFNEHVYEHGLSCE